MHEARITEWLKSLGGLATAVSTAVAALFAIYVAVTAKLAPAAEYLGLGNEAAQTAARGAALLLFLPVLWFVVRSYRRFARASRLEQPDRFTLSATTPESLIGRTEELAKLLDSVARNRVVLLDGESGCGKSALVAAGLVPRLLAGNGLLPVLVRDWGDDWVRGPLATALGASFEVLSPEQRASIGWTQAPDLAADAATLATELGKRFAGIAALLGRRPLLIADQFDDYQARHREKFLDQDGNWLKSDALATANPFWSLAQAQLCSGALHLLVVTRADTASGLSCLRFLDTAMTADRHLPRVDLVYLRQLLDRVAPAEASPPVVSQPDQGWQELRERLEADLSLQGAILMQQVRTVLLGLRQLPVLTVAAYRSAGELRGVESLVVARAIRRAGDVPGVGESGQMVARRLLGALVLRGGTNQPPKAQRVALSTLAEQARNGAVATLILQALQADDVVRPAEGVDGEAAWQLDHDYLARAVLAEARQADRWGIALHEGLMRFRHAAGDWRRRWLALLPIYEQVRMAWERARGRLSYGEAAGYARLSLVKPALAVLLVCASAVGTYVWNVDRLAVAQGRAIYDRFGGTNEVSAIIDAWQAPQAVRDRLFRLVQEDEGRLDRAIRSNWPLAHGGLEADRLVEAAHVLSKRLARERDPEVVLILAKAYASVIGKLSDPSAIEKEVEALRGMLASEYNFLGASGLAMAYATVAAKLSDQSALKQEVEALRKLLAREDDPDVASHLAQAYASVAAKRSDPFAIEEATEVLHQLLVYVTRLTAASRSTSDDLTNSVVTSRFAVAYATVSAKLSDQSVLKRAVEVLRMQVEVETRSIIAASRMVEAYAKVSSKLSDPSAIKREAEALRYLLARTANQRVASGIADAYATVAVKLSSQPAIKQEAEALRQLLFERNSDAIVASSLAEAYAKLASKLSDPSAIKQEAETLRELWARGNARYVASAYSSVASKISDQSALKQEAEALRDLMVRNANFMNASDIPDAYATVVSKLSDQSAIKQAAEVLREEWRREVRSDYAVRVAEAYATVASKISEQSALKQEAEALRERWVVEAKTGDESRLAIVYATVASKLSDPSALKRVAEELRERWSRETFYSAIPSLAAAYAMVAAKLSDPSAIEQEAEAMRLLLERENSLVGESLLRQVYGEVAARLADPSAIKQAADALSELLVRETIAAEVPRLATAYASVSLRDLQGDARNSDKKSAAPRVKEILTLVGHPLLYDATTLLSALEPIAGRSFGSDAGAAVAWWMKEFGGDPATLRPLPTRSPI